MKIIHVPLLTTFCLTTLCFGMDNNLENDWKESPYLNTRYLENYKQVADDLKLKEKFTEEYFPTEDNLLIRSLFFNPKNAKRTIIFCAGWYPGAKEGMVSFYPMFKDQNCAMLFFDARGAFRYSKNGEFLRKIKMLIESSHYGENEYKDVIAAIQFAHTQNKNLPIYILGVCAGAFHASHALMQLNKNNKINMYNIKGFIFDSGWTSFTNVAYAIPRFELQETIASKLAQCCRTKYHRTKNPRIKRCASCLATTIGIPLYILYTGISKKLGFSYIKTGLLSAKNAIKKCIDTCKGKKHTEPPINKHNTNLKNIWSNQYPNIPTLFIHSYDDPININQIKDLAQNTKCSACWWIDKPSKHTYHNLKYKEEYQEQVLQFFKKHQ